MHARQLSAQHFRLCFELNNWSGVNPLMANLPMSRSVPAPLREGVKIWGHTITLLEKTAGIWVPWWMH